jgi:hypothetical protein
MFKPGEIIYIECHIGSEEFATLGIFVRYINDELAETYPFYRVRPMFMKIDTKFLHKFNENICYLVSISKGFFYFKLRKITNV